MTRKALCIFLLQFCSFAVCAQVVEEWCAYPGFRSYGREFVIDYRHDKSIYVASCVDYSPSRDFVVFKYDSNGIHQWTYIYNDSVWNTAEATSIGVDSSGNIYATGFLTGYTNYQWDIFTIKLNSTGNLVWSNRYNGTVDSSDAPYDMVVNDIGEVYVTGYTNGPSTARDIVIVKYDTLGDISWLQQVNGFANRSDAGKNIAIDPNGDIIVSGYIQDSFPNSWAFVSKYDPGGILLWTNRYAGPDTIRSLPDAMDIDSVGNIYLTGSTSTNNNSGNIFVAKFSNTGTFSWDNVVDLAPTGFEFGTAVKVKAPYVYSTGYFDCGPGCGWDIPVIKLDTNGINQWVVTFNDTVNASDFGRDIGINDSGQVFVVGTTYDINYIEGLTTLIYDSTGALIQLLEDHNYGYAAQLEIDNFNFPIVLGTSTRNAGWSHSMLIKYGDSTFTSIRETNSAPTQLLVYPNPGNGQLTINHAEFSQVEIYNVLGERQIFTQFDTTLKLENPVPGIYFIRVTTVDGETTAQFVVM